MQKKYILVLTNAEGVRRASKSYVALATLMDAVRRNWDVVDRALRAGWTASYEIINED